MSRENDYDGSQTLRIASIEEHESNIKFNDINYIIDDDGIKFKDIMYGLYRMLIPKEIFIEAVNKYCGDLFKNNIPMKPICDDTYKVFRCPVCKSIVYYNRSCPNNLCRQFIDWNNSSDNEQPFSKAE